MALQAFQVTKRSMVHHPNFQRFLALSEHRLYMYIYIYMYVYIYIYLSTIIYPQILWWSSWFLMVPHHLSSFSFIFPMEMSTVGFPKIGSWHLFVFFFNRWIPNRLRAKNHGKNHGSMRDLQDPKMEVLTIYKAYFSGLCKWISPKYGPKYSTVPPF